MITAPLPVNESRRLTDLYALKVLDSQPDDALDGITSTISFVTGCPIALVSLVDKSRQWFKSSRGLGNVCETGRDESFCAHAILQPEQPLVVPDALNDERFFDNPLVTGPTHIRFYAGQPLVTRSGQAIGTLCLIDTEPREADPGLLRILKQMAKTVTAVLECRHSDQSAAWLGRLINEASNELYVITPEDLKIEFANEQACFRLGLSLPELQGRSLKEFQRGEFDDPVANLRLAGSKPVYYEAEQFSEVNSTSYPVRVWMQKNCYDEKELVTVSITDDSLKRQAQARVQEKEQHYQDLYNRTPFMLHSTDHGGQIAAVSDYWLEHLGYTREQVIGKHLYQFVSEASQELLAKQIAPQIREQGFCRGVEMQMIKADGSLIDVEISAVSELSASRVPTMRVSSAITDVTERNQARVLLEQVGPQLVSSN